MVKKIIIGMISLFIIILFFKLKFNVTSNDVKMNVVETDYYEEDGITYIKDTVLNVLKRIEKNDTTLTNDSLNLDWLDE